MTGLQFYDFLCIHYRNEGQEINKYYSFVKWLDKKDSTKSFQFKGKKQIKSVPKKWLVDAKNAMNKKENINRNWFNRYLTKKSSSDCRVSVALWLLKKHNK